ncbi:MAG: hypothetical protein WC356_03055 [Candidatus Micrarchaeia archaeon]|jgi:hypothetical protein
MTKNEKRIKKGNEIRNNKKIRPIEKLPLLPLFDTPKIRVYKTDFKKNEIYMYLNQLHSRLIRTLKVFSLIPEPILYINSETVTFFLEQIKNETDHKRKKYHNNYFNTILIIQRMMDYLKYNGIERFLSYLDHEILNILKELKTLDSITKNSLNMSFTEIENFDKKVVDFLTQKTDRKNWRKEALTFIRSKKVKSILTKTDQFSYIENFFLFEKEFHNILLNTLNQEDSKITELIKILKNSDEEKVILVSNKKQIEIIQNILIKNSILGITLGTPGEINKIKENFENKDCILIYFDPELIEKDSRIDKEKIDLCFKQIIKLEINIL